MALNGTAKTWNFDVKRRSDEIDPTLFPQLFYLLWYRIGIITPQEAFKTYVTQWRFVNYEMMSNDERMLLIELIDELSDGIFEPFFDDLGQDRRPVIVDLKMMPYDEMIEERAKFIGPQKPPQRSKMQVKLTPEEELKLQEFADRLVAFQMSKLSGDPGSN